MKSLTLLLAVTIAFAIGAIPDVGAEVGTEATTDGSSFSITASLKDLGTTEQTSREIDGVTFIYPVDEADTIELLLPRIQEFRKNRQKRAPLEAAAIRELLREFDHRERTRKRVRHLLGIDQLSFGFDHAYDLALLEIDSLYDQWEQWSGDISEFHLYNQATVKPFRMGDDRVVFEELNLQRLQDGNVSISLEPGWKTPNRGIGSFDPARKTVRAFRLEVFNQTNAGQSAEDNAEYVKDFISQLSKFVDQIAVDFTTNLATDHLLESVLLYEIETQFFASKPPRVFTRALARYYFFLHGFKSDDGPAIMQRIASLFMPDFSEEPEKLLARMTEMEELDPLTADSPEHETDFSRAIAFALFKLGQNPGLGSPTLRLFKEKGVEAPENGFDRESFLAALSKVYPEPEKVVLQARDNLISSARQYVAIRAGETEPITGNATPKSVPATEVTSADLPPRATKKIDGTIITYPPKLEEAVDTLATEWASGLKRLSDTIQQRFSDTASLTPPVVIIDETLDAIRELGIPAERATAAHFAQQAAFMANATVIFLQMFNGSQVQVWTKNDLKKTLKSGGSAKGFSLKDDGNTVTYKFMQDNLPIEKFFNGSTEDAEQALSEIERLAIPVVVGVDSAEVDEDQDDPGIEDHSLEEQIAALKKGAKYVDMLVNGAAELTPEAVLGKKALALDHQQSYLITVHEVVEVGLLTDVIASKDRRWFCDGMANLIAMRECDRTFGKGSGMIALEKMFSPESVTPQADQIDLFAWQTVEDEDTLPTVAEAGGLTAAHYYYATKALLAATEGRGEDFPAKWIAEIKKTNWNRTNAQTVIDAYHKLTGEDLEEIVRSVTKK